MRMTLIRSLLSLVLLLAFCAIAASTTFAQRGQIYTIQKGDTLWGLSQRFIEDPYYWPNIWSDNPDITNPHLIFPGQQIRIFDGRLEIIPAYTDAESKAEALSPQDEQLTIRTSGRGDGFLLVNEQPLGRLVDSVDNRILLTETDLVFVKMINGAGASVDETFGLFNRGRVVRHPQTKEALGTMMHNLGFLTVTEVRGTTIVARIDGAYREITRGAELFAYRQPVREIALQQGNTDALGFIVASQDEKGTLSTGDMIFIDLGEQDQLATGNLLYISRPRQISDEALRGTRQLDLPDQVLGAAIVTELRGTNATAIIIKSVDAAAIGDNITVVTN